MTEEAIARVEAETAFLARIEARLSRGSPADHAYEKPMEWADAKRLLSLARQAGEMREALEELQDVFAREDENPVERFDRLAAMFDRDTGYMAPGKSRPMHRCDQPDGPELHRIYDEWFAAKVTRARTALSQRSEK